MHCGDCLLVYLCITIIITIFFFVWLTSQNMKSKFTFSLWQSLARRALFDHVSDGRVSCASSWSVLVPFRFEVTSVCTSLKPQSKRLCSAEKSRGLAYERLSERDTNFKRRLFYAREKIFLNVMQFVTLKFRNLLWKRVKCCCKCN
jgi:hypothetical protein